MDFESAIDMIYSILEHGFERHIIEEFYEAHNEDISRTIDALTSLSLEELEGLQQDRTDHDVYDQLVDQFAQVDVSSVNEASNTDSLLLPELESHTEVLNDLVCMFEGQISNSKLQELLLEVVQGNDSLTKDEQCDRTVNLILSHISIAEIAFEEQPQPPEFDDIVDSESFQFEEVNLKRDYNLFVIMFSGVIKDNRMKKIWKQSMESCLGKAGARPETLSVDQQEDVMDVAVVKAMEFMDLAERKCRDANISSDSQLAASLAAEDGYVYDPPPQPLASSSLQQNWSDYDIDEEQEYYSGQSTQEAALHFIRSLLNDELPADVMKITDQQIEQALEVFRYDFDECLKHLRDGATALSTSTSSSAKSGKSNKSQSAAPISYKQSVSAKSLPGATVATSSAGSGSSKQQTFPQVGPPRRMVYRSFRERNGYIKMNEELAVHFLGTLRKKNSHIRARLGDDRREIVFEGVNGLETLLSANPSRGVKNVDKYNASHVAIDLHNLGMDVAVQVVDSTITFFLNYIREYNQRSHYKGYKLVVKFIVGKGLHSPGGVPKIGPAVLSYLANERVELVACLVEGMIYVTCI